MREENLVSLTLPNDNTWNFNILEERQVVALILSVL